MTTKHKNDLIHWFWWKIEGTKFKYFRTKTEQKEFARNLGSLERIDVIIKNEVDSFIKKAEERSKKLARNQS